MSRLTRKPRLFGSRARHLAGASAMLLSLSSSLAGAQEVQVKSVPLPDLHEGEQFVGADTTPAASAPGATGNETRLLPRRANSLAATPLGWTAAGVLLALALCPPAAAARTTEGA